jgi:hypothetical protein
MDKDNGNAQIIPINIINTDQCPQLNIFIPIDRSMFINLLKVRT